MPPPRRWSFWGWLRSLFAAPPTAESPARVAAAERLEAQEQRVLSEFCRQYEVEFNDLGLLKLALTHRSYLSVTGRGPGDSNERLEFLGDSVLGLVTSEFLYRRHPDEHEGQLTKTKSLLVSKAILSRRALKMGLGRYVLLSHSEVESGGRQRLSILADAFESVLGAVYLDQGFETARAFIHKHLLSESDAIVADKRHTNYKSHLQEYVQSTYRTHPVYRIRSEYGPDHSKHFMVEVLVGKKTLGQGRGHNKKEAEQAAARDALDQVKELRRPREVEADERPSRRERTDEERSGRRGAGRDEAGESRGGDDTPRARRSAPSRPVDDEDDRPSDVEADEPNREGSREGRRRRRRGSGRDESPRTPIAATPLEPLERETADEPAEPGWDDDASREEERTGPHPAEARPLEPDLDEDEYEDDLEDDLEDDVEDDAEDDVEEALVPSSAHSPEDRREDDPEDSRGTPVDDRTLTGRAQASTGAESAASMAWGRSRRRGPGPRGAAAPAESVPLTEAAVDPYESEQESLPPASERVPAADWQPEPMPVIEVEPEVEGDEESRQARIDEIEQALASFGRRTSKQGRRGRRR